MAKKCADFRKFRINTDEIIRQLIFEQAGTLNKAVMESAMNAVDKGAATIRIDVTETTVRIQDDGAGFVSEEDITANFEEFGRPHIEGDARYGRYRIGRGQMFAQGRNTWKSGSFVMRVDAKTEPGYVLDRLKSPVVGCDIVIELYNKVTNVTSFVADLADDCRYMPATIVINGTVRVGWSVLGSELSGRGPADRFNHKFVIGQPLRVYNQGVYAFTWPATALSSRGMSGGTVSTTPGHALALNQARNEVKSTCPLWAQVVAEAKAHYAKHAEDAANKEQSRALNAAAAVQAFWRLFTVSGKATDAEHDDWHIHSEFTAMMRDAGVSFKAADTVPWIPDVHGALRSIQYVRRYPFIADATRGNQDGDRLMQQRRAFPVCVQELPGFRHDRAEVLQFLSRLVRVAARDAKELTLPASYRILERKEVLASSVLTVALPVASRLAYCARYLVYDALVKAGGDARRITDEIPVREIYIGDSSAGASARGWTDGHSYIALDKKLFAKLGRGRGMDPTRRDFELILKVLVHEYCHNGNTTSPSHLHDTAFYRQYHDALIGGTMTKDVMRAAESFHTAITRAAERRETRTAQRRLVKLKEDAA